MDDKENLIMDGEPVKNDATPLFDLFDDPDSAEGLGDKSEIDLEGGFFYTSSDGASVGAEEPETFEYQEEAPAEVRTEETRLYEPVNADAQPAEPEKEKKKAKTASKGPGKKKKGFLVPVIIVLVIAVAGAVCWKLFKKPVYTVSFKNDDGKIIEEVKVKEGQKVQLITEPKKEGFKFCGWQQGGIDFDVNKGIDSDTVLTAVYKKLFKVVFAFEDHSEYLTVEVADGDKVEKPEKDPIKKNKAFVSWRHEGKKYDFESPVKDNLILTAEMKDYIPATGIAFTYNKYDIKIGEKFEVHPFITPSNTTDKAEYKSSDPEIFTVDENCVITGKKEGTATLTAKVGNLDELKVTINVKPVPVSEILLPGGTELIIPPLTDFILEPVVEPENATDKTLTFTSSDEEIVKIGENGNMTAYNRGDCTVTISSNNGKVLIVKIHVGVPVEQVVLDYEGTNPVLLYGSGKSLKITARIIPEDADVQTVKWNFSENYFSCIVDGNTLTVSPLSNTLEMEDGATLNITATADGIVSSSSIKVEAEPRLKVPEAIFATDGDVISFAVPLNCDASIDRSQHDIFCDDFSVDSDYRNFSSTVKYTEGGQNFGYLIINTSGGQYAEVEVTVEPKE